MRTTKHNQQSVQEDADASIIQNNKYKKELFSVAPMMAHTNRHYRFFWRLFSSHAFLYTEMIPAGQIVSAYDRELKWMGKDIYKDTEQQSTSNKQIVNSDQILEVVRHIQNISSNQSSSGIGIGGRKDVNSRGNIESLNELLRFSEQTKTGINTCASASIGQTTLQIGGCDPYLLAKASAIGAAFGYSSINLNCGCPSSAVSGRAGGVSHMKDPMHVAKCVESMNQAVTNLYHSGSDTKDNNYHVTPIPISVKHRLGVRDAASYNAQEDRLKNDEEEAFPTCREFVKAITFSGNVNKVQVHTRLGLLGDFDASPTTPASSPSPSTSTSSTLWVPGSANANENENANTSTNANTNTNTSTKNEGLQAKNKSIDHKRVQYQAKQRARKATIHNRSIPPLRPHVVDLLADEFPNLEFVANGGIHSMASVQDRISKKGSSSSVIGAMVGRAAINHPCSFATADSLWEDDNNDNNDSVLPSRGDVLLTYIDYCDEEEQRVSALGVSLGSLAALRRRLAAVPFHLFVGEECNNLYQRRIRKLVSRAERHTAKSILMAALYEMPAESINKSVGDFTSVVEDQNVHRYVERSGPLQKSIY